MERGSVVVSKCENALKGTALLKLELVAPAEFVPLLEAVDVVVASAFTGGASVFAAGVYSAVDVSAFEPADDEPIDDVDDAAAPLVPAEELL